MKHMPPSPAADITVTVDLVKALLSAQCPVLADLPVTPFATGWDNAMFRLGDSMMVRLPVREVAAPLIDNEIAHLARIDERVDLPLPSAVFAGSPSEEFPHSWAVIPFTPGVTAARVPVAERSAFAEDLADFLWTLHAPATSSAPDNPFRGGSLATPEADARARARIETLPDADALLERWAAWTSAPDFDDVDRWLHGDLHPHNMIVGADGRLASVVDWGDLTSGDPACDLATAWLTFDDDGRRLFRERMDLGHPLGEAMWTRAKAWALHLGLIFATMSDDRPEMAATGQHALAQLLTEKA